MSQNLNRLSNTFCVAPWIHAHVAANGKRRLCCIAGEAPEQYAKLKFSDFKNSEYMKSIRQSMLLGVSPPECHYCQNPNRVEVYRDKLNKEYDHRIEEILHSTRPDGFSTMAINYLDYRSNLCNLKCRTCDPGSSSAFHKHVNAQNEGIRNYLFPNIKGKTENEVSQYFSLNFAIEMIDLANNEEVDRVYFAGGEPVIEPGHFMFLQNLIESGLSSNVTLCYNTNLSFSFKVLEKWIQLIGFFKSVSILVSVDGHRNICEYIREGMNFDKFDSNLKVLSLNPQFEVKLDITLTSLNLFFLEEFAEFVIKRNLKVVAKLMCGGEDSFPLLRTEVIPEEQKILIISRWEVFFGNLKLECRELLYDLNSTINLFKSREQNSSYSISEYLNRLYAFESMYPHKSKFLDLLCEDSIGRQWSQKLLST